jgi:hypothetical protein
MAAQRNHTFALINGLLQSDNIKQVSYFMFIQKCGVFPAEYWSQQKEL